MNEKNSKNSKNSKQLKKLKKLEAEKEVKPFEEREERINKILDTLPKKSGVYLMKNKYGKIIYVGKAKVLRNRVRQYFDNQKKILRTKIMVSKISDIEYIITTNENEALLLEANLIKKYMPKYNVLLKDDKAYPYLKLTDEKFPTLIIVRKKLNDGGKYFGPYAFAGIARDLIKIVQKKFKIRTKRPFKLRLRPCLNFEMNLCDGPCIGNISKEDYDKKIAEVSKFLSGDFKKIIRELEEEMLRLAENENFEKAAEVRDTISKMKKVSVKQKISNFNYNSIDTVAVVRDELNIAVEVFQVRNSKMQGRKRYKFKNLGHMTNVEFLTSFLKQYYIGNPDIPNKIMVRDEFEEKEALENLLKEQAGYKVEINFPKIGEKYKFLEMAEENAKNYLNENKSEKNLLEEIKETLDLKDIPRRIEMYDVSNISGAFTVSAMVVLEDGKLNKSKTRKFRFDNINVQNDVLVTKETILKRMRHNIKGKKGLGDYPDLILADGSINQINAIKEILKKLNLNIKVFGLVKDNKHKTRALIDENRNEIALSENLERVFSNMQEEVHNAAINYHRSLRAKALTKSKLDEVYGIGKVLKQKLLLEFKSLDEIKKQSVDSLMKVKGITKVKAEEILRVLND